MTINVKAKPDAPSAYIKKIDDINFEVAVKEPPVNGLANRAIINSLAGYFKVNHSNVRITQGWRARNKVIEIK